MIYKLKYILSLLFLPLLLCSENATLLRVIDGDTLLLKTQDEFRICQISYIDAPEMIENEKLSKDLSGCKVSKQNAIDAGLESKNFASTFLKKPQVIEFEITRVLENKNPVCDIKLPKGVHIELKPTYSEVMISQGYALPFVIYSDNKNKEKLLLLAKEAQKESRGLWRTQRELMMCLVQKRYSLRSLRE